MTPKDKITLRPAISYALLSVVPLIILALLFLALAWILSPSFILFSLIVLLFTWYRLLYIRSSRYEVNDGYIRFSKGLFLKRTEHLEMYRIKDYIQTQTFTMQLLRLMNLTLKGTDPENPSITMTGIPVSDIIDDLRERVQQARVANNIYEIN
jgi:uncharacterized membrane protein YdbT with pleckstrin-like domain